ncbi:MAG: thioredoxin domain-containing protein [Alistipes sp.]|nr:thioredoxin domain-containing protein [Alistipes sp.]
MEKFDEIVNGPTPVLVDFHATWCGPCRTMHPILEQLKREVGDKVRIVKLDIDKPSNRALVDRYGVRSVPTLMFFRSGIVVWRGAGVTPCEELIGIIEGIG